MPFGVDMGGYPEIGGLARYNPATGNFPTVPGVSVMNLGPFVLPRGSELSLLGTGTLSYIDKLDRLQLEGATNTTHTVGYYRPIIGAPYTLDLCGGWSGMPSGTDTIGLALTLTDGTKFWENKASMSASIQKMIVHKWTNSTTSNSTPVATGTVYAPVVVFLRITDDGTTTTAYFSNNGKDYAKMFSEATGTFLTPTQYGVSFDCGVTNPVSMTSAAWIYHLAATPGILGDAP